MNLLECSWFLLLVKSHSKILEKCKLYWFYSSHQDHLNHNIPAAKKENFNKWHNGNHLDSKIRKVLIIFTWPCQKSHIFSFSWKFSENLFNSLMAAFSISFFFNAMNTPIPVSTKIIAMSMIENWRKTNELLQLEKCLMNFIFFMRESLP